MTDTYADILYLPRPESFRHKRMPPENRAAQFAPFAALTGYDDAIAEAGRRTDVQITPGEDAQQVLDQICQTLMADSFHPQITVTHFIPDSKKSGGQYKSTTGTLKQIKENCLSLQFIDGTEISLDTIVNIEPAST